MKGGTYAEALKAGFTEQQAAFFSRLGGETRDEAVDEIKRQERLAARDRAFKRKQAISKAVNDASWLIFGALVVATGYMVFA